MGRLDGKVAVITGAGGGLGGAMAVAYAREGAAVVCQDLRAGAAEQSAAAAAETGARALPWTCDVADSAAIEAMFSYAADRLGVVDVVVSNAGVESTPGDGSPEVFGVKQLAAMSDDAWRSMLDVHVTGAFNCSRAMVRRLLDAERPGSLICISSIVALSGYGKVHYATAKAALLGLVRSVAVWGGKYGIRANAICPGMIETPMTAGRPEDREWILRRTPLRRVGTTDDLTPLAVYLASDESSFVTGQTISPNGGIVVT
jgi:NAD(P)-dependent dehydrogenase (short-subunit alcohol dehydrogenase family)